MMEDDVEVVTVFESVVVHLGGSSRPVVAATAVVDEVGMVVVVVRRSL